jgi:hypothetical protein
MFVSAFALQTAVGGIPYRPPGSPPPKPTVTPTDVGLAWLAKTHELDGHWDCRKWRGGDYGVGATSLAILAFADSGLTHTRGKYKQTVARAFDWLRARQKPDGSFPWTTFEEQGIATMAAAELYGMTRDPAVKRVAQAAVDYIVVRQPEHGGFDARGAASRENGDTSVTTWQILALKGAVLADLAVPDKALERCHTFLANVRRPGGQSARRVGDPASDPAASVRAMVCKCYLGGSHVGSDYDAEIKDFADALLRDLKAGTGEVKTHLRNIEYIHDVSMVMFVVGGEHWYWWHKVCRPRLVKLQVRDRDVDDGGRPIGGSWDPANHNGVGSGGRVHATALASITLRSPHRCLSITKPPAARINSGEPTRKPPSAAGP